MTEPLLVERSNVRGAQVALAAVQQEAARMVAVASQRLSDAERALSEAKARLEAPGE